MPFVAIPQERLRAVQRYGNAIRNKAKRDYFWRYLAYLQNGAEGLSPERGTLSYMGAQAVRMALDDFHLWEEV